MTKEELDLIGHATGRNYTPRHVRNAILVEIGSPQWALCMGLANRGLMESRGPWNVNPSEEGYVVTEAGEAEYLRLRPQPKLTPGQKRYRAWLDADSGMSFIEWLKLPSCMRN